MMFSGDDGERIKENCFLRAFLNNAADPAAWTWAGRSFQSIKALGKKQDNVLDLDTRGSGYLFEGDYTTL